MGYFDGYQVKSKSGVIVDGEQLQKELDTYGQVTANVTENKYGYNQEDVINVAKLLHEANVRQLDVKTDIASSPLLYKKAKDASGNEITVKRGHFEKKKLLKDAREYEERMNTYIVAHPVVEEYNWSDNLDESIDDVPESMLKEQEVEEPIEAPMGESIEKLAVENADYLDKKKFAESDEEIPDQKDQKKLVLNKYDRIFLSKQSEELGNSDRWLFKSTTSTQIKKMEDSTDEVSYELHENMTDAELIDALKHVNEKLLLEGGAVLTIKNSMLQSNFARIDELSDELDSIVEESNYKFSRKKLYELSFKFKLLAMACASREMDSLYSDGKLFLQLSRILRNRSLG